MHGARIVKWNHTTGHLRCEGVKIPEPIPILSARPPIKPFDSATLGSEPLALKALSCSGTEMVEVQMQTRGDAITNQSCKIIGGFK